MYTHTFIYDGLYNQGSLQSRFFSNYLKLFFVKKTPGFLQEKIMSLVLIFLVAGKDGISLC